MRDFIGNKQIYIKDFCVCALFIIIIWQRKRVAGEVLLSKWSLDFHRMFFVTFARRWSSPKEIAPWSKPSPLKEISHTIYKIIVYLVLVFQASFFFVYYGILVVPICLVLIRELVIEINIFIMQLFRLNCL